MIVMIAIKDNLKGTGGKPEKDETFATSVVLAGWPAGS
jgi:hypothetical protein